MANEHEDSWGREAAQLWRRIGAFFDSLAGRLLGLTAVVVLIGEISVFLPALASFHETWLRDRINLAQVAALALEVAPEQELAEALEFELLENAEVIRVAMKRAGERELLLENPSVTLTAPIRTYDYSDAASAQRFAWAAETFIAREGRVIRVLARPRFESGEFIEIVLNEASLKREMGVFARSFAFVSTLILMAAGAVVYGALSFAFVRPMGRLTQAIERFRDHPEDASVTFVHGKRADEVGRAERAAGAMAEQIRLSLRQRERLAALGAAVARIGHDLRNMLATAQIVTERLSASEDPNVRQIAPRLERAIGRAAGLAATTLRYGRADETPPALKPMALLEAAEDAVADALTGFPATTCTIVIDSGLIASADPEHVHRILVNLIRNAAQAMSGRHWTGEPISVRGARDGRLAIIDIVDHGPGVPSALSERLFEPFVSADRQGGGTGLGLAIARELARGMGGEVTLVRSGGEGAVFRLSLSAV